jgi:hypothetical protein
MRILCMAVMLVSLTGCFRFSDPVFAFKPLEAEEPPGPEYSLLFVTVLSSPGLFGTPEFYSLWFARVDPHGKEAEGAGGGASSHRWYRAFRPRVVKDGHFMILVPPGAYELDTMAEAGFLGASQVWRVRGDARIGSRIQITRPGIYDLGTLKVMSGSWTTPASIVAEGDAFSEQRLEILGRAVRGTSWEKLLESAPENAPGKKKKRNSRQVAALSNGDSW